MVTFVYVDLNSSFPYTRVSWTTTEPSSFRPSLDVQRISLLIFDIVPLQLLSGRWRLCQSHQHLH